MNNAIKWNEILIKIYSRKIAKLRQRYDGLISSRGHGYHSGLSDIYDKYVKHGIKRFNIPYSVLELLWDKVIIVQ